MGRRAAQGASPARSGWPEGEAPPEDVRRVWEAIQAALEPVRGSARVYRSWTFVQPEGLPSGASVLDVPYPGSGWRISAILPPGASVEDYQVRGNAVAAQTVGKRLLEGEESVVMSDVVAG